MRENVPTLRYRKRGATFLLRKPLSWLQLHPKRFDNLVNELYLQAGDIAFRYDALEQLCNAKSHLWDANERGLAKLMYRLGPAVGLQGDISL